MLVGFARLGGEAFVVVSYVVVDDVGGLEVVHSRYTSSSLASVAPFS